MHTPRGRSLHYTEAGLFVLRPADIVLIVVIVASFAYGMLAGRGTPGGEYVRVTSDGAVVGELPLGADTAREITGAQGTLTLEVRDRRARVSGASCPRGICRHAGWIRSAGEAVVCVPNRVTIEIKGGKDAGYDAVTH